PTQPAVELFSTPSRYVAGQETALVRWLNGGEARPVFQGRPFEHGVAGRPTLVDNVETLAHIGLLARFGAAGCRAEGPDVEPGPPSVTAAGGGRPPGVYEIPVGYPLAELLGQAAAEPAQAFLIGGYFGAWVRADLAYGACLSTDGLALVGAS